MMRWPWSRSRIELTEANQRAAEAVRRAEVAEQQDVAADFRLQLSEQLAERSLRVTARLRSEIEKNGWTELLQHAWGGR